MEERLDQVDAGREAAPTRTNWLANQSGSLRAERRDGGSLRPALEPLDRPLARRLGVRQESILVQGRWPCVLPSHPTRRGGIRAPWPLAARLQIARPGPGCRHGSRLERLVQ